VFSKAGNIKSRAVVFCWTWCFKAVFKGSIMENKLQQFNPDIRKALLTVEEGHATGGRREVCNSCININLERLFLETGTYLFT